MNECPKKLYGKYRGTVVNNEDPESRGRIQVNVTDVSNFMVSNWAMPSLPVAGFQSGISAVPSTGAGVWVEFEQGDPSYPIWTGCFFGTAAEVPSKAQAAPPGFPPIVLQSITQNKIAISSTPSEGIILEVGGLGGPSITISPTKIVISDGMGGEIKLAQGEVSINGNALVVKRNP